MSDVVTAIDTLDLAIVRFVTVIDLAVVDLAIVRLVTVIDLADWQITEIPLGKHPVAIAVNRLDNTALVVSDEDRTLTWSAPRDGRFRFALTQV